MYNKDVERFYGEDGVWIVFWSIYKILLCGNWKEGKEINMNKSIDVEVENMYVIERGWSIDV